VMHSFSGDVETALACVELGLYISFAGMVTFKKNDALRAVAAQIPLDRLLIETDSPYLAPVPFRGKRNEPAHVRHTAECLATVRNMTPEEIGDLTAQNARRLFPFSRQGSTSAPIHQ
jgi:TatD DNase family protein